MNRRIACFAVSALITVPSTLRAGETGRTAAPPADRGYLGIVIAKRMQNYVFSKDSYPLPGLMVRRIHFGSPAGHSELKLGDVIHAADGRSVDDEEPRVFLHWIATLPPGKVITLTVRNEIQSPLGDQRQVRITVADRFGSGGIAILDGDEVEAWQPIVRWMPNGIYCWPVQIRPYYFFGPPLPATLPAPPPTGSGFLGIGLQRNNPLEVRSMWPSPRHLFNIPEIPGIIIERVLADSPASRAGLAPGDIIVAIESQRVANQDPESFMKWIASLPPGKVIALTIWRGSDWPRIRSTSEPPSARVRRQNHS